MTSSLTVKVGADVDGLRKELNKASGQLQNFNKGMMKIGGAIAGAFAVDKVLDFGKAVFDTTAKFQKFEAVLTNTLGSNSAAKAAMAQITEFAAKTPYGVDELTASFVKLANQGFVPTINQMRSLGDLAASQGKTFDQLTEAIIDAQTGEFERLKEFGIRASKQGDQVEFTFKGVKKQVDFTSDSIRQYILALGDVEGVAGGMEAQSKTLGGGLSNLEDAFEQLKLTIGEAAESGGLFSMILDGMAEGVKGLTNAFKGNSIQQSVDALQVLKKLRKDAAAEGDIESWIKYNDVINAGTVQVQKYYEAHIVGQKKLEELQNKTASGGKKRKEPEVGGAALFSFRPMDLTPLDSMNIKLGQNIQMIQTAVPKFKEFGDAWVATWARVGMAALNVTPILNEAFISMSVGLGEAIGDAASGAGGAELIFSSLLAGVGSMCTQLGQLAIATGFAVSGIKKALLSLNPAAAITGGIALVAIGKLVSNKAKSIASSGSGGGSSGGGASGGDASGPRSLSNGREDTQHVQLGGYVTIKGEDLVIAFKNAQDKNQGRRG
jgi:hypothetical protein